MKGSSTGFFLKTWRHMIILLAVISACFGKFKHQGLTRSDSLSADNLAQRVKFHLGCPHHIEVQAITLSVQLSADVSEKQRIAAQVPGPCHPRGCPGWLLASVWANPGSYGHLGNEPVDKRWMALSPSFLSSLLHPAYQIRIWSFLYLKI